MARRVERKKQKRKTIRIRCKNRKCSAYKFEYTTVVPIPDYSVIICRECSFEMEEVK